MWASDNGEKFPFHVSVSKGGTKDLCERGVDGFDKNSASHFLVMSNELGSPKILLCPDDLTKRPATNFNRLSRDNVTYQVHSGPDVDESRPAQILAVCPFHQNILYADGSVVAGKNSQTSTATRIPTVSKTAQMNSCVNNLRLIDSAKQQLQLEQPSASLSKANVLPYVGRGASGAWPTCPTTGTDSYNIGGANTLPSCANSTMAYPHVLPE
jgi:hypothetical protein